LRIDREDDQEGDHQRSKQPEVLEDLPETLNNIKTEEVLVTDNNNFKLKDALQSPEKRLDIKGLRISSLEKKRCGKKFWA
jgi:hypothetical protein